MMIEHTDTARFLALCSPVEVLRLGEDADRYMDAVRIVPIGDGLREHVTLRCGSAFERWQVGCSDTVAWVRLAN